MKNKELKYHGDCKVYAIEEYLNIISDYRDPKEAIREAISNGLDWGATEISIEVMEDLKRPELIVKIHDNGQGINKERLEAFFNLGQSTAIERDDLGHKVSEKIGEKGHGTKTYFNSRQIEVESQSKDCLILATMNEPLLSLHNDDLTGYDYDLEPKVSKETYTSITLWGFNQNKTRDFEHNVLKDYILWFTKFGSVEREVGITKNANKALKLKGLGAKGWEIIKFGHIFPTENSNIQKLRQELGNDWPNKFVKRWVFQDIKVAEFPDVTFDLIFYLEGNQAKLDYNKMIRRRGLSPTPGMYSVEDRYGLYVCKDYIPVERVNEWISTGQLDWTKYHAFVNCQAFNLTANRGSVGNTRPDLLEAIEKSVRTTFEEKIRDSTPFQEYEDESQMEKRYRSAKVETGDFGRRLKALSSKQISFINNEVELLSPRTEAGVFALFAMASVLYPKAFPFRIVDYDTAKGYDALCTQSAVMDLTKDQLFFVEFKYVLKESFDHSFDKLGRVVCWDCKLGDGTEVHDLVNNKRILTVNAPTEGRPYTQYMLTSRSELHNIEVLVLKNYLKEKLNIEFKPRTTKP